MAVPVYKCPAGVSPKGRRHSLIHSARHRGVRARVCLLRSDPVSHTRTWNSRVTSWVVAGVRIQAACPGYQNEDDGEADRGKEERQSPQGHWPQGKRERNKLWFLSWERKMRRKTRFRPKTIIGSWVYHLFGNRLDKRLKTKQIKQTNCSVPK